MNTKANIRTNTTPDKQITAINRPVVLLLVSLASSFDSLLVLSPLESFELSSCSVESSVFCFILSSSTLGSILTGKRLTQPGQKVPRI